jgi:glycosyltransferase involved in cell wall biosynthesis|tara:strand:+ start:906 stop:2024 length:1119 start_codon:yes stop_codon:yes gene_type:complete
MKIAYFVSMKEKLETFITNEINLLSKKNFKISIFSTLSKSKYITIDNSNYKINNFNILNFIFGLIILLITKPFKTLELIINSIKYSSLLELIFSISWFSKVENKFDLLHGSFGDRKFFIAFYLSKLTNIKLSVTIHAHEIYAQPNKKLFILAMNHASLITTISQKNKKLLIKDFLINENKIKVIKLPIDSFYWNNEKKINVLTVARFTPRKGWFDLFKVAKIISNKFHFIAVGFGDLDMEEEIKKRKLENKITVYRSLNSSQIKKLMEFSDIFFLPSKFNKKEGSEGIPVVLMEAMSMKMKIVSTEDGSISELVDQVIVKSGNINQMINALNAFSKGKKSKIGVHNRSKVMKLHNLKNIDNLKRHFEKFKKK